MSIKFNDLEILQSLQNDNFLLDLEPQVNRDKKIITQEALIRWQHPKFGLLFPGAFLPTNDSSNLMREIDYWVLNRVFNFVGEIPIAVNLANATLCDRELPQKILKIAQNSQADLTKIEIEIHELLTLSEQKRANISFLKEHGFKIVLDDYGTGNSELQKIMKLPVDKIKIDRSVIADCHNSKIKAVIESIIDLTRKLKIEVCAEGIETEAEFSNMKELGCNLFQGYLFEGVYQL